MSQFKSAAERHKAKKCGGRCWYCEHDGGLEGSVLARAYSPGIYKEYCEATPRRVRKKAARGKREDEE